MLEFAIDGHDGAVKTPVAVKVSEALQLTIVDLSAGFALSNIVFFMRFGIRQ